MHTVHPLHRVAGVGTNPLKHLHSLSQVTVALQLVQLWRGQLIPASFRGVGVHCFCAPTCTSVSAEGN